MTEDPNTHEVASVAFMNGLLEINSAYDKKKDEYPLHMNLVDRALDLVEDQQGDDMAVKIEKAREIIDYTIDENEERESSIERGRLSDQLGLMGNILEHLTGGDLGEINNVIMSDAREEMPSDDQQRVIDRVKTLVEPLPAA